MANAFFLCLHGGIHYRGIRSVGKHHALRVAAGRLVKRACKLAFLSHKLFKPYPVRLPVGDGTACHAAVHGCFGHGHRHLGDKARVDRFGYKVFRAEGKVVYGVFTVHDVGHGTLGQIGKCVHGSEFHLLVNTRCGRIERTAEQIGETKHVVYLVGVIAAPGAYQAVGACLACVLV